MKMVRRVGTFVWIATGAALFVAATAWAQGRPNLNVQMEVAREVIRVDADGQTTVKLEPATETRRGDVLVYTLRYENTGSADARSTVLSDPIPAGTVLIRDSARGADAEITFSLDGKTFADWPRVQHRTDEGETAWIDAPASAVKHVRWTLAQAVPPGGTGSAAFKVVVQ